MYMYVQVNLDNNCNSCTSDFPVTSLCTIHVQVIYMYITGQALHVHVYTNVAVEIHDCTNTTVIHNSFSPAGIPLLDNHNSPVVSVTPISADTPSHTLVSQEDSSTTGLSFQLATLDRYVHVHVHWLLKLKFCDVAQFLLACIGTLCRANFSIFRGQSS